MYINLASSCEPRLPLTRAIEVRLAVIASICLPNLVPVPTKLLRPIQGLVGEFQHRVRFISRKRNFGNADADGKIDFLGFRHHRGASYPRQQASTDIQSAIFACFWKLNRKFFTADATDQIDVTQFFQQHLRQSLQNLVADVVTVSVVDGLIQQQT